MESTFGMTAPCMKESGSKIRSMDVVSISGQMVESTMASGKIIICTAKVFTPGKTVVCTKVTTRMTASMAMVSTLGMMVNNMKAGGRMESSMEKVSTEKMAETEEASGKMARESSGSMT